MITETEHILFVIKDGERVECNGCGEYMGGGSVAVIKVKPSPGCEPPALASNIYHRDGCPKYK